MAENALIAAQDLAVCGDTIHRSVAAVDVRHLPEPTGSTAVSSRVRRPLWIKSVLALLYHVFAVKYKKMWVVFVKITENLHILG